MPSKKKPMPQLPAIPQELIDRFVTGPMNAEAVHAASMAFKKALIERALGAEMSHHLGYPPGAAKPEEAGTRPRRWTLNGSRTSGFGMADGDTVRLISVTAAKTCPHAVLLQA